MWRMFVFPSPKMISQPTDVSVAFYIAVLHSRDPTFNLSGIHFLREEVGKKPPMKSNSAPENIFCYNKSLSYY